MTVTQLWQQGGFTCVLWVTGADRPTFTVQLEHGEDVLRERVLSSMDAATAQANLWRTQMMTARTAAMASSTPYKIAG